MNKKEDLTGLSGWLGFYVAVNIIAIIYLILNTFIFLLDNFLFGMIFLLYLALDGYSLYNIFKYKKRAIIFNRIFLWVGFIILLVMKIILIFQNIQIIDALMLGEIIGGLLFPLIGVLIWDGYWRKSKRVKNTFIR